MKKYFYACIFISLSVLANGLSIEEAIEKGKKCNKEIVLGSYEVENQKYNYQNEKLSNTPDISWGGRYSKSDNENISNSISTSITLYNGGKIKNNQKKSYLELEKEKINEKQTKKTIVQKIRDVYVQAINENKKITIYENSIKEMQEEYKKNRLMYEKKMISKVELLDLENSILEKESELITLNNNYTILLENLKKLIGIEINEKIKLQFEESKYNISIENINLDEDIQKMYAQNIDLKESKLELEISEKDKKIAKAEFLPKVDLSFSYGSGGEKFSEAFDEWSDTTGISVSYNLFEWGKTKNNYKQKEKTIEIQKLKQDVLRDELELTVKEIYYDLQRLVKVIDIQKKRIEASKEAYEIDKVKYEKRSIEVDDFLKTENQLLENEIEYENLKSELYLKYEEYKDYIN